MPVATLERTAAWGAPNVAAGVVSAIGELGTIGDRARVFPLASVTKLLTSMATLIAVEEGTVDLDEPAGPEGSTVRHLLAHASGLGVERGDPPLARAPGASIRMPVTSCWRSTSRRGLPSRSPTTWARPCSTRSA